MQEGCEDFYALDIGGCCLDCPNAYPGCLCYECKCKKCFWYSPPEEYDGIKGHCDKTDELIKEKQEERRAEARERYIQKDLIKSKKWKEETQKLELNNEKVKKELKEKGEITSSYTCQKCKREFTTKEEFKTILNKTPVCGICSGELL